MDISRNDPCPCGSGKKYKKCCEAKDEAKQHAALEKQWTEAVKKKEKEDQDAEKQAEGKPTSAFPTHVSPASSKAGPQKHQTFAAPKFNMPRKSGGG